MLRSFLYLSGSMRAPWAASATRLHHRPDSRAIRSGTFAIGLRDTTAPARRSPAHYTTDCLVHSHRDTRCTVCRFACRAPDPVLWRKQKKAAPSEPRGTQSFVVVSSMLSRLAYAPSHEREICQNKSSNLCHFSPRSVSIGVTEHDRGSTLAQSEAVALSR